MAIQGPLRELGVHDVFQLLDLGRKTGTLRISSELRQNEGTIWFEAGAVVAAAIRTNPHPLGGLLLRAGAVSAEDLARATALQERGDARRLGEILVGMGALAARELEIQVRAQVEDVVFTLLGWSEGHFIFEEGPAEAIPRDAEIRLSTESVLLEAARRIDEWSAIEAQVPHLGVVARLTMPSGSDEPGSLRLVPFEWRVLAAVDGRRDVREVATLVGASEFATARALFGLSSASVIVLHDPAAASAAAAAGMEAATLLQQAEEHLRLHELDAARSVARAALAGHPDDSGPPIFLGRVALLEGRPLDAQEHFRDALRLTPSLPQARRLLGVALAAVGRMEDAARVWEEWLALSRRPMEEERRRAQVAGGAAAARVLADLMRTSRD
jgi:tetratricopeptide (TPR) repeat protein